MISQLPSCVAFITIVKLRFYRKLSVLPMLSKGGEFKTLHRQYQNLLVEIAHEPSLTCGPKENAVFLPQVRHQQINVGRGRPLLLGIGRHCPSGSRHTLMPHLTQNGLCEIEFLNHKTVRQSFPKASLEDDLHLESQILFSH